MNRYFVGVGIVMTAAIAVSLVGFAQDSAPPPPGEVIASGLDNPRGFAWGPDGLLYVALAGSGDETGQVVKIEDGEATVVVDGMHSDVAENGSVEGVAAVDFLDDQMYFLLQGGGVAHKAPEDQPAGVYTADEDGNPELVADIGAWVAENLTKIHGEEGDAYNMIAGSEGLYVVMANPDAILEVKPDGSISLVADLAKDRQHEVVTGLAVDRFGSLFVGTLSPYPFSDGTAKVFKITKRGDISEFWTGLTAVTSMAIGPTGRLYALEMTTGNTNEKPNNPNSGMVVRRSGSDGMVVSQDGLNFPIAMRFDPDGALYVAGPAVGGTGEGWITKLEVQ